MSKEIYFINGNQIDIEYRHAKGSHIDAFSYKERAYKELFRALTRHYIGETIYIVNRKMFGRVEIIEDKIGAILYTGSTGLSFKAKYTKDIYFSGEGYDDSCNVFYFEKDAYEYANKLISKRKIKLVKADCLE